MVGQPATMLKWIAGIDVNGDDGGDGNFFPAFCRAEL